MQNGFFSPVLYCKMHSLKWFCSIPLLPVRSSDSPPSAVLVMLEQHRSPLRLHCWAKKRNKQTQYSVLWDYKQC